MGQVKWCLSRRDDELGGDKLRWVQFATSDNVKYVQACVETWFTASAFFLDNPESLRGDLLITAFDAKSGREVWREELQWTSPSHVLNFDYFYAKYPQYSPIRIHRN